MSASARRTYNPWDGDIMANDSLLLISDQMPGIGRKLGTGILCMTKRTDGLISLECLDSLMKKR